MQKTIIHTNLDDLPFIYSLFDDAIIYQRRNGYPDWKDYSKDVLEDDILKQKQFKIIINEEIACIFTCCLEDKIVWRERDQSDAIYLHRIVSNKDHKGQKLFQDVLSFTISKCKELNRQFIRLDTWANNDSIINYYASFGFDIVKYSINPDIPELPIQMRGNRVALMEYKLEDSDKK